MPFSCTVYDRFGDIWRDKNFVHIKNLALYTQGKVDTILSHIFLFDHIMINIKMRLNIISTFPRIYRARFLMSAEFLYLQISPNLSQTVQENSICRIELNIMKTIRHIENLISDMKTT